jgi:hypothetical protein
MSEKFPGLRSLTVNLSFYDAEGITRNGQMKCKMHVEHARSALWFACHAVDCLAGDFDLSAALASAVAGHRKQAVGELRCPGARRRGGCNERVPCQAILRYKLNLDYD